MSMRLCFLMIAWLPSVAYAEVMDKEFAFSTVALWTFAGAAVVLWSARFKPWVLAVVLPAVVGFFSVHLPELADPHVGPAIRAEAGSMYVFVSWAAPVLIVAALGVGMRWRFLRA